MKNRIRITNIIRLLARISGSIILIFLLFFTGAHVIEALSGQETGNGGFNSAGEMFTFFVCFPIGTMIGLAIAWKWEGLGGLTTIGATIGLFVMRPDLSNNLLFLGIGLVGILFLVYWLLNSNQHLFIATAKLGKAKDNELIS